MLSLVVISDTHGRLPAIPECEILVQCGDFCPDYPRIWDPSLMRMRQMEWLDTQYREWEAQVPAKHIIGTYGNHDWVIRMPDGLRTRLFIDEGCEIDGMKFWGTPWTPPIADWHYQLNRTQRAARFSDIPEGLDVLVCHSPAHRVLDMTADYEQVGCPELRAAILRKRPGICVFGHVHECGGRQMRLGVTMMYNAAIPGKNAEPTEILLDNDLVM